MQGVVIIEATIGPNGKVQEAKVLRSIPLLDAAALDAVRQWEFTPTLLNGVPVPVIMTVTVNFTVAIRSTIRQLDSSDFRAFVSRRMDRGFNGDVSVDDAGWRKLVAFVLFIMSMWSLGVGIERFFTCTQARNQSKLYAPQVAKHLKEGRLKDAIALSTSKNYRYSHLAKVVLAGLQEYQFQQESGGSDGPRRPDGHRPPLDSARVGAHRVGPEEGRLGARDHRLDRTVRRTARHGGRRHQRVPGHRRASGSAGHRRRLGRYFRSARRNRARPGRRDSGGLDLQLPDRRASSKLQRGDGQLLVGAASTTSSRRRRKLRTADVQDRAWIESATPNPTIRD